MSVPSTDAALVLWSWQNKSCAFSGVLSTFWRWMFYIVLLCSTAKHPAFLAGWKCHWLCRAAYVSATPSLSLSRRLIHGALDPRRGDRSSELSGSDGADPGCCQQTPKVSHASALSVCRPRGQRNINRMASETRIPGWHIFFRHKFRRASSGFFVDSRKRTERRSAGLYVLRTYLV